MHMKDDHMRNGQLKPGYNVQFAVNSGFITGIGVFSNRTVGTLIPFLTYLAISTLSQCRGGFRESPITAGCLKWPDIY